MRWAVRKVDRNHADLLETLRRLGWDMESTHALPNFVDAVGVHSRLGCVPFEFKAGKNGLTDSQQDLLNRGWPLVILRTADEAIAYTQDGAKGRSWP